MRREQRTCLHCGEDFIPDARNAHHQRYCTAPACRAASKRASHAKWLAKPENRDYYRGPEAVARVQAWRRAHPGYRRRKASLTARAETEHAAASPPPITPEPPPVTAPVVSPSQISCNVSEADPRPPLQDLLVAQPVALVGLIAHIGGSALQEDIASALNRLIQLGQDIRGGEHERNQAGPGPGTPAPGAGALQLARSSLGAGALL